MIRTVLVLAKEPRPGKVKTRLTPPFTPEQAAQLAAAALWDTLRVAGRVPARQRVLVFDGDASRWRPEGWQVSAQRPGGLDVRIAGAFAGLSGPAVLIGMDTPQLRPEQVDFDQARFDACFGPSTDGGFWAIGFADPALAAQAVPGVPMSHERTGEQQLQRLCRLGLRVQILDELTDFDTLDSARVVARQAAGTAFAQQFAASAAALG